MPAGSHQTSQANPALSIRIAGDIMATRGLKPRFTNETIAVAFELRSERIPWKTIDRYLGDGVAVAAHNAGRRGMYKHKPA